MTILRDAANKVLANFNPNFLVKGSIQENLLEVSLKLQLRHKYQELDIWGACFTNDIKEVEKAISKAVHGKYLYLNQDIAKAWGGWGKFKRDGVVIYRDYVWEFSQISELTKISNELGIKTAFLNYSTGSREYKGVLIEDVFVRWLVKEEDVSKINKASSPKP
jgi:hypothetical protein